MWRRWRDFNLEEIEVERKPWTIVPIVTHLSIVTVYSAVSPARSSLQDQVGLPLHSQPLNHVCSYYASEAISDNRFPHSSPIPRSKGHEYAIDITKVPGAIISSENTQLCRQHSPIAHPPMALPAINNNLRLPPFQPPGIHRPIQAAAGHQS